MVIGKVLSVIGIVFEFASIWVIARKAFRTEGPVIDDMGQNPEKEKIVGDAGYRIRARKEMRNTLTILDVAFALQSVGLFLD